MSLAPRATRLAERVAYFEENLLPGAKPDAMEGGTMRTTYWLVAVAAVSAAGVTVYARLRASDLPVPKVPLTAEPPRDVPELKLPPVVIPPDEPLALPDLPGKPEPVSAPRAPTPD